MCKSTPSIEWSPCAIKRGDFLGDVTDVSSQRLLKFLLGKTSSSSSMASLPLSLTPSSSIISSRPITEKKQTRKNLKLKMIKKCCSCSVEQGTRQEKNLKNLPSKNKQKGEKGKKSKTENSHVRQFQCRSSYHPKIKISVGSPYSFLVDSHFYCLFATGRSPVLKDQLSLTVPSHLRKSEER